MTQSVVARFECPVCHRWVVPPHTHRTIDVGYDSDAFPANEELVEDLTDVDIFRYTGRHGLGTGN